PILDTLVPALQNLASATRAGVKDEHYDTVGAALLKTLGGTGGGVQPAGAGGMDGGVRHHGGRDARGFQGLNCTRRGLGPSPHAAPGRFTVMQVPPPARARAAASPPWRRAIWRTSARPSPVPTLPAVPGTR